MLNMQEYYDCSPFLQVNLHRRLRPGLYGGFRRFQRKCIHKQYKIISSARHLFTVFLLDLTCYDMIV
jgi:hypothetical protein